MPVVNESACIEESAQRAVVTPTEDPLDSSKSASLDAAEISRCGVSVPEAATFREVCVEEPVDTRVSSKKGSVPLRPKTKPLLWIDPRTKLALLLLTNIVLLLSPYNLFGHVLKILMMALITAFLILMRRKTTAFTLLGLFLIALMLAVFNNLQLFSLISSAGIVGTLLRFFTSMMLQFIPGTVFAFNLVTTTKASEFIAAMQRMHVSRNIIIPFAVMFRFIPTVFEEYRCIQDAMRMRGIVWARGLLSMVEYRIIPLIVSVVKIGDELSAASVARGLGGSAARTSVCRIGFGAGDAVFFLWALGLFVILSYVQVSQGVWAL